MKRIVCKLTIIFSATALALTVLSAREPASNRLPGEQRRWAIDFRARIEQPGVQKPVEIAVSGDWSCTITGVRPGEYDAELQLTNIHMKGDTAKSFPEASAAELERSWGSPFWVTYANNGALLSIYFSEDVSRSNRNLLELIATETQFVRPDPDRLQWTVLERDGGGEYLTIYNRLSPNVFMKRKLKYLSADGAPGIPANSLLLNIQQSELHFSVDSNDRVVGVDGSNRVSIGLPLKDSGQLTTITETHLSQFRQSTAMDLVGSLERMRSRLVKSPIVTQMTDPEEARSESDERLLAGHTTQSLLDAAITRSTSDPLLGERLTALFRKRPEAARAALVLLQKDGPSKAITNALGSAGSPQAIEALANIAHDKSRPTALRVDALDAFVLIHKPSPRAMHIPESLLDDSDKQVAWAAKLSSGALARAGRPMHEAEANRIDAILLKRYNHARDTGERADLLSAFGNSVGPSLVPVIESVLRDPQDPARAAAARALRLADGPEVDTLLARAITSDTDPGVRLAAISAAGFRHPLGSTIGEALVHAAQDDTVDYVRSNAISLLRQNPDSSPHIHATLASIADHDDKPGLRRLARQALDSLSGQQNK